MGKKYAVMLIFDPQSDLNERAIKDRYKTKSDKAMFESLKHAPNDKKPGQKELLKVLLDFYAAHKAEVRDVDVKRIGDFWVLRDENLGFETIRDAALDLSRSMTFPIVYVSNFDDDLFMFGVYCYGTVKTTHAIGECLDEYGMEPAQARGLEFMDLLKLTDKASVDAFCEEQDVCSAEEKLSSLLGVRF